MIFHHLLQLLLLNLTLRRVVLEVLAAACLQRLELLIDGRRSAATMREEIIRRLAHYNTGLWVLLLTTSERDRLQLLLQHFARSSREEWRQRVILLMAGERALWTNLFLDSNTLVCCAGLWMHFTLTGTLLVAVARGVLRLHTNVGQNVAAELNLWLILNKHRVVVRCVSH